MIERGKRNVLGVNIDAVDYEAAVERIVVAAQSRRPLGVAALAVHGVMTGVLDREHRHRLNALELVVPDGQPVRWALNGLHRAGLPERVCGPRLMQEVCAAAEREALPIYLFGGTEDLLARLQSNLQERFPGLQIAGTQASRFRQVDSDEQALMWEAIRESGAAITFVGLGCPRQEIWAWESRAALEMPVIAVGAAFNFHAGLLRRAPEWMQRSGLEWLFRFGCEPVRLWKRYLLLNPLYLTLLAAQGLGLKRFDPSDTNPPTREWRFG